MGELDLLIEEIFFNIARHSYPEGPAPVVFTSSYRVSEPVRAVRGGWRIRGLSFDPKNHGKKNAGRRLRQT